MVAINNFLKVVEVQSGPGLLIILNSGAGMVAGMGMACGVMRKKAGMLHHDRWSAVGLAIPGICSDRTSMSK